METKRVSVKSAGLDVYVMDGEGDDSSPSAAYVVVRRGAITLLRLEINGDTASVTYRRPLSVSKHRERTIY